MKPPRPRRFRTSAVLAALSLLLLACAARAQNSPPPPPPDGGDGPGRTKASRNPEDPFTTHDVTKRAVVTPGSPSRDFNPPPDVPPTGVVRLHAVLSASGDVTNIIVLKGLPGGLTEKAIEAARQIKFTPAQKDGRAVSQYVTLEYNFNIYYEEDDKEITKKVEILEQPKPGYTDEALKNHVAGKVVVEAYFLETGKVAGPSVVEGLPDGLSEKAIEAALLIKFKPAEMKGRKVRVIRRVEYVFSPDANAPTAKP
jgi:TonB family protein